MHSLCLPGCFRVGVIFPPPHSQNFPRVSFAVQCVWGSLCFWGSSSTHRNGRVGPACSSYTMPYFRSVPLDCTICANRSIFSILLLTAITSPSFKNFFSDCIHFEEGNLKVIFTWSFCSPLPFLLLLAYLYCFFLKNAFKRLSWRVWWVDLT